nr:UDP-glucuronosyltransferase 2B33-like [Leptinotarsa decemlineata]
MKLLVIISTLVGLCESARILGVVPTPSFSHQVAFRPLWRELAKRGHDLVVITTDPENDPTLNLTEIDISSAYELWEEAEIVRLLEELKYQPLKLSNHIKWVSFQVCDHELGNPKIQALLKNESEYFDLVIVEFLHPIMLAFAERFHCPHIGVASMELPTFLHNIIGNPVHPIAHPDVMLPFEGELTFFQRVMSCVFNFMMYINSFIPMEEDQIVERHFGKNMPPIRDMMLKFSMMFINVDPAFNLRPLGPAFVSIGGGTHLGSAKPLPKNLQEYMDGAEYGVIYFSLGTNVKSSLVPPEMQKLFLDTFKELPYRILWKFDEHNPQDVPANVKIMNWVPQQDILRHSKVKAFITQGGLQSLEEAMFSHVPVIGIPFIYDQEKNVHKMMTRGLGIELDKNKLTKESFKAAILEVINNPRYKEKAVELAKLSRDQPMTGLEKAVWWTEYVLRHRGAPNFRNPVLDMPFYQYYLIDVIGFLIGLIIIFWFTCVKIVSSFRYIFVSCLHFSTVKRKIQ